MPYSNPPPCSVESCEKPVNARGLCAMHYMRWRVHGDVNVVLPRNKRTRQPCSVDGCTTLAKARGWCEKHYLRWRSNGDPLVTQVMVNASAEERFWAKVDKSGLDGCWLWTGFIDVAGYGHFTPHCGDRNWPAHRYAYTLTVGPIPAGKHLDHLCRNPPCVRPDHLEPVTPRENTMRSPIAPAVLNARKTHCPKGHPYSGANLYVRHAERYCRTCKLERQRAARASRARRPG